MGLLSSVKKAAKAVVSKVPTVSFVKSVVAGVKGDKVEQAKQVKTTIVSGVVLGAAGLAVAAPAVATSVAKALIPASTKGKVIAAVAAPVVAGAVLREPGKSAEAAVKLPSSLANFGGNAATFASSPSLDSGKKLLTDNPLIAAAAGLIVAGGTAKVLAPAVGGYLQSDAIRDQTDVISSVSSSSQQSQVSEAIPTVVSPVPVTAATQRVTSTPVGSSTKKKRRASKPRITNISQRVNVIVSNRTNNKYIKRGVYV